MKTETDDLLYLFVGRNIEKGSSFGYFRKEPFISIGSFSGCQAGCYLASALEHAPDDLLAFGYEDAISFQFFAFERMICRQARIIMVLNRDKLQLFLIMYACTRPLFESVVSLKSETRLEPEDKGVVYSLLAIGMDDILYVRRNIEPRRRLEPVVKFEDHLSVLPLKLVAEIA